MEKHSVGIFPTTDPLGDVGEEVLPCTACSDFDELSKPVQKTMPRHWWATHFLSALDLPELETLRNHPNDFHISLGTDATGANGPYFCMEGAKVALAQEGVTLHVALEFGSEDPGPNGDVPRLFNKLNCPPTVMFSDMNKRRRSGPATADRAEGCGMALTRPCDVYFAGTECKDLSNANTTSKKELDWEITDQSGNSTLTLHSSCDFVETWQPAVVFMEQVYRILVIKLILAKMRGMGIYDVEIFKTDNLQFGLSNTRPRIAGVAVNLRKVRLLRPVHQWQACLGKMAAAVPPGRITDFLLEPDCEEIAQAALAAELKGQSRSASDEMKVWLNSEAFKLHESIRRHLRIRFSVDVPSDAQMRDEWLGSPGWGKWCTLREQDVLNLHWWVTVVILKLNPQDYVWLWDLKCSANYPFEKRPSKSNVSGCLTRFRTYFLTSHLRLVLGREQMMMMVFPRDMRTAENGIEVIADEELSGLAGNAIGVPPFGALYLAMFANVDFSCSHGSPPQPGTHNVYNAAINLKDDARTEADGDDGDVDDDAGYLNKLPCDPPAKKTQKRKTESV